MSPPTQRMMKDPNATPEEREKTLMKSPSVLPGHRPGSEEADSELLCEDSLSSCSPIGPIKSCEVIRIDH